MTNNRQVKECPSSPNCVSSHTERESHYISPISYNGSSQHALATLVNVLKKMKRTKIIEEELDYIHAECRSKVFRFTDDVEFFFDTENKVIEVRSASRKGYSDFGVNRKRIETIRQQFINQL